MADTPKIWLEQVARDGSEPGDEDRAAAFRVTKARNVTLYMVGDLLDMDDLRVILCDFKITGADTTGDDRLF